MSSYGDIPAWGTEDTAGTTSNAPAWGENATPEAADTTVPAWGEDTGAREAVTAGDDAQVPPDQATSSTPDNVETADHTTVPEDAVESESVAADGGGDGDAEPATAPKAAKQGGSKRAIPDVQWIATMFMSPAIAQHAITEGQIALHEFAAKRLAQDLSSAKRVIFIAGIAYTSQIVALGVAGDDHFTPVEHAAAWPDLNTGAASSLTKDVPMRWYSVEACDLGSLPEAVQTAMQASNNAQCRRCQIATTSVIHADKLTADDVQALLEAMQAPAQLADPERELPEAPELAVDSLHEKLKDLPVAVPPALADFLTGHGNEEGGPLPGGGVLQRGTQTGRMVIPAVKPEPRERESRRAERGGARGRDRGGRDRSPLRGGRGRSPMRGGRGRSPMRGGRGRSPVRERRSDAGAPRNEEPRFIAGAWRANGYKFVEASQQWVPDDLPPAPRGPPRYRSRSRSPARQPRHRSPGWGRGGPDRRGRRMSPGRDGPGYRREPEFGRGYEGRRIRRSPSWGRRGAGRSRSPGWDGPGRGGPRSRSPPRDRSPARGQPHEPEMHGWAAAWGGEPVPGRAGSPMPERGPGQSVAGRKRRRGKNSSQPRGEQPDAGARRVKAAGDDQTLVINVAANGAGRSAGRRDDGPKLVMPGQEGARGGGRRRGRGGRR